MKLSGARDHYYAHSGGASNAARQIAFAGIAVVWVFNQSEKNAPINLPEPLLGVLLFCALSLLFDLLQYASSALIWGFFSRSAEKRHQDQSDSTFVGDDDPEFKAEAWFNWPGNFCFWSKLASLAAGYGLLLDFLRTTLVK